MNLNKYNIDAYRDELTLCDEHDLEMALCGACDRCNNNWHKRNSFNIWIEEVFKDYESYSKTH